jgi:Protein of unknown function (DUF1573)
MMLRVFGIQVANRSLVLLLCSAAGLALAAGDVTFASGRPTPKAVTPFTSFNFGDVYRGEIISQIFVIRNEGDADLQMGDFTAGCGCEVTRSDRVIPPGKEGMATLEVQTVSQRGEIYKTATLHTNDPERPAIVFTLVANILEGAPNRQGRRIGPVFVSPDTNSALYALAGKKAMAEFSVTADGAPVKVLRVEGGTKHFASRVEVVEPGRSYKIVLESLPTEAGDLYRDQLRVITDSASLPAFPIDVSLRVYPRQ